MEHLNKLIAFNPATLRSRTFWTGVTAIATALTTLSGPDRVLGVIAGLSVIFLRDAVAPHPVAAPSEPQAGDRENHNDNDSINNSTPPRD